MIVPGVQKCKTNLMQISEHLIVAYNCFFFCFFLPLCVPPDDTIGFFKCAISGPLFLYFRIYFQHIFNTVDSK